MCLSTYGAQATRLSIAIRAAPGLEEVEKALGQVRHKALIATHVEPSTGVLTAWKLLSDLLNRVSPETLLVVDGAASVSCEDLYFDAWDIDIVVTGSQKAIGCPPGLSIMMVSARAMQVAEATEAAPRTWYASLPMQKYEKKEPTYFATPPTHIVRALHASLTCMLSQPLEYRLRQHGRKSAQVKAVVSESGLTQLFTQSENQASGLAGFWHPSGVASQTLLSKLHDESVVLVVGMHKEVGPKYARFGHKGYSDVGEGERYIDRGFVPSQGLRKPERWGCPAW